MTKSSVASVSSGSTPDDPSLTYTVHDAIQSVGFGRFQIILSVVAGLAWMADSMEIMLLSILTPSLVCEWGLTPFEQAMATTSVFIGWMISSPIWGWFCDRYGRKKGLICASSTAAIFGVLTAFAPNYGVFVALRSIVGVSLGGNPQSATIYTEFLPVEHRAKCVILLEVFFSVGAAFVSLLALFIMPLFGWRVLVVCASLPLLLFTATCAWLPESARFHVSHHRSKEATEILERVALVNKKQLPEGSLIVEKKVEIEGRSAISKYFALLENGIWKTTLLVWVVWTLLSFSYYGLSLYQTELFQSTDVCHGGDPGNVNVTTPNATDCVPLTEQDYIDIFTTSLAELPGLLLTFLVIEHLGRRLTMGLQLLFFGLLNFVLYFCLTRTWMVVVLFIARALIAGAFQTAYVYTPEVYPTPMRALGLGAASGWARAGAMVSPLVAQMIANYNIVYAALIYGATGVLGGVASFLLPIETTGREMHDSHVL